MYASKTPYANRMELLGRKMRRETSAFLTAALVISNRIFPDAAPANHQGRDPNSRSGENRGLGSAVGVR